MPDGLFDAMVDLLLGGRCIGCTAPGRVLCRGCERELPRGARPAWPTPTPAGLATPWATAAYDGVVKAMVVGHKEHRLLALRDPLAVLLADAVAASDTAGPVVLVPVPSRPASVRARGHDPTHAMAVRAAALLGAAGHDVVVARMLRPRTGVLDQAGLGASERSANLAGSMYCPATALRRLADRRPRGRLVVCDDVITTGSTAREAQRALEVVGLRVAGIAAVAATRRRNVGVLEAGSGLSHRESSALRVSPSPNTH